MYEADLMKAKLNGGTTWLSQQPHSSSSALEPNPNVDWSVRGAIVPMGPTKGAVYDFNPVQQWTQQWTTWD